MFGGYAFQTAGLAQTTPSKAAFITGFSVVLVPLLLALFGSRRAPLWVWVGALAAFAGLYFLAVPPSGLGALNRGDLLVLACAFLFALHVISIGHYTIRYSAGALTLIQIATTELFTALCVPIFAVTGIERPRVLWTPAIHRGRRRHGNFRHGPGLCRASLGAAVHQRQPRGHHFFAGAGIRRLHVVRFLSRTAGRAGFAGSGADPGRNPDRGGFRACDSSGVFDSARRTLACRQKQIPHRRSQRTRPGSG